MKYALTYGLLSGSVVVLTILAGLGLRDELHFLGSEWFGYLVMLVALTFIFVGVKRYRDVERGGVVKFGPAFLMGLSIAVVAALAYVVIWEGYLAATGYRFMDEYIAAEREKLVAAGVSGDALSTKMAGYESMREMYANPLLRVAITFLEIIPVGLVVALVSAALLRNPKLLPAAR